MKIIKASIINPLGGLNFVISESDRLKIGETVNKDLPIMANQSKYSWRDILYSYWSIFYCGGD